MTAVEYLIEQLQVPCRGIPSHIIEQAKEMEKQQIESAYEEGYNRAAKVIEDAVQRNILKDKL